MIIFDNVSYKKYEECYMKKIVLFILLLFLVLQGCSRRRIDDAVDPAEIKANKKTNSERAAKYIGRGVFAHAYKDGVITYKATCHWRMRDMADCYEAAHVFCGEREAVVIDEDEKQIYKKRKVVTGGRFGGRGIYVSEDDSGYDNERYLIFICKEN